MANELANSFLGKKVKQYNCDSIEYYRYIGRESIVVEVLTDEKNAIHCRTADDIWCPLRLLVEVE